MLGQNPSQSKQEQKERRKIKGRQKTTQMIRGRWKFGKVRSSYFYLARDHLNTTQ